MKVSPALPRDAMSRAFCTASARALAWSAAVTPAGRSYTTTAVTGSPERKRSSSFTTCVDCAPAGSQLAASSFWTSLSRPESGPSATSRTTQNASTPHLARLPETTAVRRPPEPFRLPFTMSAS
ncbi:hypothetical protein [Actinomadura oligospora]|uniref:hypothetical protein n=1 Tax=Actinomadura oligospora TaxID=111804 RepID=UPI00047B0522|nr:hypothetical protein [Actinomadura oligospora]